VEELKYHILRKYLRRGICFILLLYFVFELAPSARAIESTAYTYTRSADSFGYIRTQDAYMPGGTYLAEIGLNAPEDIYYKNGAIYIADSGNGRIVRYQLDSGNLSFFGEGELKNPTGVAVSSDGRIFIADYGAEEIVVLSPQGEVLQRIARPEDIFYGSSPYKPKKVDIDSYGNIFAISEGTHEGILQFNSDGGFNGFFGANKTKGLNLIELFQKTFYTDEQKAKLFFRNPPNIVSINVAENNLVYSVTQNDYSDALKKLNLAGVNVLQRSGKLWGEENYVDVAVTVGGDMIAVTDTGSIEEFDDTGILMLLFGGRAASSDRNGLTAVVSAIEVDDNYNIYVLDKERALIQTYYPTDYANLLHQANLDYNEGRYQESLSGWTEIMRMNSSAYMAHNGYAKTMFQLGEYEIAAKHYELIRRPDFYSDCYWEIRSNWLRENMQDILMIVIGITIVLIAVWLIRKKWDFLLPVKIKWREAKRKNPMLRDLTDHTSYMERHPIDCLYDLKFGSRGSVFSASILYGIAFIIYMCSRFFTSFVFGGGLAYWQNPMLVSLMAMVPVILFVIGSYLISSINDGEGTIKNVYVAVGYVFVPYIKFTPVLILISHVLTYKEIFIYNFSSFLITGYTLVLLFLSVKEIHCYTPKKTMANILLTIAFMIIAILAFIILYILWKELFSFLYELIGEVNYRVFS
jgi:tetratricopeptide (TPR) repeat protein